MGIEKKGWGVSTSKKFILKVLCKADKVDYKGDEEDWCPLHPKTLHDVEVCPMFKELLKGLMNESDSFYLWVYFGDKLYRNL